MQLSDRPALSKRERAARLLCRGRIPALAFTARRHLRRPTLTILAYHNIAEAAPDYPFDADIIDATPAQFRAELDLVSRHFSVIGLDQLLAARAGGSLPPNPALITFDDGYKSNHDLVLPVLRQRGLPAVFFIATNFVDERRVARQVSLLQ
jgi:peptidoglycan/xylan/chitin deacetylase (PgdA/CDA1 family)